MGLVAQKIDENDKQRNKAEIELRAIKRNIVEICTLLCEIDFEPSEVIAMLHEYIIKDDRIMYSYISDYIYALTIQAQGQMVYNMQKLYEYTFTKCFKVQVEMFIKEDDSKIILNLVECAGIDKAIEYEIKRKKQESQEVSVNEIADEVIIDFYSNKIRKAVMKLMDHINLATYQYVKLNHDDEYFENKIGQYAVKLNSGIEEKLNESSKENMNQLLSLIGIFTALSFMVFGGMTSLDSLFSQIKEVHTLKLVLVGSLWGLVLFDLLAVFEYFVSRVSGKTFKYTNKPNASFYQKYPLVIIGNIVLGTIFLISSWLYFIALEDMGGCYINWVRSCMPILGIGVVVLIIVFMGVIVYILNRKKNINEEENINNEETHTTL